MSGSERYRDAGAAHDLARAIARRATRPWTLMEVCGGQTHSILRYGIDELLPPTVELLHGPGCPVCVTPVALIDCACELACRPGVTLFSFGDMLRVPGSRGDLNAARARGGDVRIAYSPLDALDWARRNPRREVVFFAVGFETTAPATALCAHAALEERLSNFSLLAAHVRVPPALEAILAGGDARVDGFLAAGHVCTVMGTAEYEPLCARHRVPIVVTGFEPIDLLEGVLLCVTQLEAGHARVENQYARAVRPEGNPAALALLREVFEPGLRSWRGLGPMPASGLRLRPRYASLDAERRFHLAAEERRDDGPCMAERVLRGEVKPPACPAFGTDCTPLHPLGAPMVSGEGACAAYFRYRGSRRATPAELRG